MKFNRTEEPSLKDSEITSDSWKVPLCKKKQQLMGITYDSSQIETIDLSTVESTCKMVNTTNMKNISMPTDSSRKKKKKSHKLKIHVSRNKVAKC